MIEPFGLRPVPVSLPLVRRHLEGLVQEGFVEDGFWGGGVVV